MTAYIKTYCCVAAGNRPCYSRMRGGVTEFVQ